LSGPTDPLADEPGEALTRVRGLRKQGLTDILRETPEMVATLATGAVAQPLAGLRGLATLATGGGLAGAVGDIEDTQEKYTYAPRSEGAQAGLKHVSDVIEPINEFAREHLADPAGAVSPALGAAVASIPAVLPGPKGLKGAVGAAGKAAKAGTTALRGVEATEAAAAPVAASGASQLRDRLQAVGDAQRAYSADGSPANGTALAEAQKALRLHREQRNRERGATGAALDPAAVAMSAMPPGYSPSDFEAGLFAARRALGSGANFDEAHAAVRSALAGGEAPEAFSTAAVRGQPDAISVAERAMRDVPKGDDDIGLRGRVLGVVRDAIRGGASFDQALHSARTEIGRGRGVFRGEDWIPEPPVRQPEGSVTRQDILRQQKSLLPNVDPGWEHQTLIPGLEPLTPAQGAQQRARRLGVKTRILREGDPAMNRDAVLAFYEGGRDNPEMFQYGVDPRRTGEVGRNASLDDYAAVFGRRAKADIDINYTGGDESIPEPEPKRHGRGEPFRDEYGDYVMKKRTHEAGDVPVYDEHGDPKKVKVGLDEEGLPIKEKYEATGGEPVREGGRYGGSIKYDFKKTRRHGRPMRDERGDIKYEEPDYDNYDSGPEKIEMRAPGGGEIDVSDYGSGGEASVYAGANSGKYGSLLYQTLLNHASHAGEKIGGGSLTDINALRILSNANSNYARTGINPRGLRGTASGDLPNLPGQSRAHEEFAEGPEIWRSESAEALKRALRHGGKPDRMAFHPDTGFTLDGIPASPDELKGAFESMSPRVKTSGVGMKTLMRSAVFDWVRDASPKEAADVARNWSKKYGPLFGVAGVGLTLQDVLRERERGEQ